MSERDAFPTSVVDLDESALFFAEKLRETGVWDDMLPTNVGAFIQRIFAGAAVGHQHGIHTAARNAFFGTAQRDSSIYALTRGHGVFMERRAGASVTVRMRNGYPNTMFVPPFSQHVVDSTPFYNPAQYYVVSGQTSDIILTQGVIKTKTFDLDAIPNLDLFEFLLGEPGFNVSTDLYVTTTDKNTGNQRTWEPTERGLYEYTADDYVYFHSTTASGDVSLIFGTGEYGAKLPTKTTLTIRYVVNEGTKHNAKLPGIRTSYIASPMIQGETLETTSGGADPKTAAYYRTYAPVLYRAKDKWISVEEIAAGIRKYPGVADCAVLGQRDIAPEDKTWMNTIRVCVLPENTDNWGGSNPNPKSASWQQFVTWLQPKLHGSLEVQAWNPSQVLVKVQVQIAFFSWAAPNVENLMQQIEERIYALFKKRHGILKRRVSKSDIEKACRLPTGEVDYIEVLSPIERSIVLEDPTSYCVLAEKPLLIPVISERVDE